MVSRLMPGLKRRRLSIDNTGTKKTIVAQVPVDDLGAFQFEGRHGIAGVPATGIQNIDGLSICRFSFHFY